MLAGVASRRYFCTACHVPQSDVPPLVENVFPDVIQLTPSVLSRRAASIATLVVQVFRAG